MKKIKFIIIIILMLIIIYLLYIFNYIPHKKYENKDFGIEKYISNIDFDNDGIDDETDILESTKKYLATKPKYKSKYYIGGYPDDSYGVCTDVVSFGLKGAGYDLKKLVNDDINNHKDLYNIDIIDENIDFRRVKNLKIYFESNAIKLTNDIYDISNWQGGDIVIFNNHIGIVSDKRNKKGITFVLHHANPYQLYYEEDILTQRKDIVGHYRIS